MIVAARFARDRRRSLLWWTIGVGALVLFTVALFPTVKGEESFEELADKLPASLRSLFGLAEGAPLTSAPGYLHARLFSTLLPVILVVFAIGLGARAIGGSEEDGTLELLVAQPVTRLRIAVERSLAAGALLVSVSAAFAVMLLVAAIPFGALDGVSIVGLAGASAGAFCLALLHGSVAYAAGAATGRRGLAMGVAAAFAVTGYLVEGLITVSDAIRPMRFASPWHWYLGRNMLVSGVAPDALIAPLLLVPVIAASGTWLFLRRDLR